jgi:hypothetical protein
MGVTLIDYATVPAAERNALVKAVAPLSSLELVLDWARKQKPACELVDVLIHDEYSHDVVLRLAENRFLAFDTT